MCSGGITTARVAGYDYVYNILFDLRIRAQEGIAAKDALVGETECSVLYI